MKVLTIVVCIIAAWRGAEPGGILALAALGWLMAAVAG